METFCPKFEFLSPVYPLRYYFWMGGITKLLNCLIFFKSTKGSFGTVLIMATVPLVPQRLRLVWFIPFQQGITPGTECRYFNKTVATFGKVLPCLGSYPGMPWGIFKFLAEKRTLVLEKDSSTCLYVHTLHVYWARQLPLGVGESIYLRCLKLDWIPLLLKRFCFSILNYIIKLISTGLDTTELEKEVRF